MYFPAFKLGILIPGISQVAQWLKKKKIPPGDTGDTGLISGSGRSPGGGKWQPTPVLLPGKSYGWRNIAGYSPWDLKVRID